MFICNVCLLAGCTCQTLIIHLFLLPDFFLCPLPPAIPIITHCTSSCRRHLALCHSGQLQRIGCRDYFTSYLQYAMHIIAYYAAVLIGHIRNLGRPSVRVLNSKSKTHKKTDRSNRCANFYFKGHRSKSRNVKKTLKTHLA